MGNVSPCCGGGQREPKCCPQPVPVIQATPVQVVQATPVQVVQCTPQC